MDWTKAIAINRAALARIVQEILALMDYVLEDGASRLPRVFHSAVLRQLRPAEAALRRLIVMMARDVTVRLQPARPMPKGLKFAPKQKTRMAFRLQDPRKRLPKPARLLAAPTKNPRVHFFGTSPLVPLSKVMPQPQTAPLRGTVSAAGLRLRVAALKSALENLAKQAKRMALWRLRRALKANVKFTSPLRPGLPPGHTPNPKFKVDRVLAACHGLAFEALTVAPRRKDSS